MPDRLRYTGSFEQDAAELLDPRVKDSILRILAEKLPCKAEFGQRVRGTARLQVWPVYPNDGFVYVAYYRVEGDEVVLLRLRKRATPMSPQLLDLEDD